MTTDSGEQEIYEIKNGADHLVVLNSVSAVLASGALFSTSVVLPSIFTILTGEQIFVIRKKNNKWYIRFSMILSVYDWQVLCKA